jgi:hypothetical protein
VNRYAGADVSLEASSVCVIDANGNIVREAKVASEPQALIAWFGSLGFCPRGYAESERRTVSAMRSTVGRIMSSRMSAAGSGTWGVVIRTGGPSRS